MINEARLFQALQRLHLAENITELAPDIGQYLCECLSKTIFFDSYLYKGGEGAILKIHNAKLNRPGVLKIGLAHLFGGKEDIRIKSSAARAKPGKEVSNTAQGRFFRGANIQEVLTDKISGKNGSIPKIRATYKYPVAILMDFAEGETAINWAANRQEPEKLLFFLRCLGLVGEIHSYAVVHSDLKANNFIIDASERPVLIDFSLSKNLRSTEKLTKPGFKILTPGASPKLKHFAVQRTFLDDIYMLGEMLLLPLLWGDFPDEWEKIIALRDFDPRLVNIYKCATADKEENRYQTTAEFANAISKYIEARENDEKEEIEARAPTLVEKNWGPELTEVFGPRGEVINLMYSAIIKAGNRDYKPKKERNPD